MNNSALHLLRWIKPTDRLPNPEHVVALYCGHDQGQPVYFFALRRDGKWLESNEGWVIWDDGVRAWAEIPPPEGLG